jgi:hypothetical protein
LADLQQVDQLLGSILPLLLVTLWLMFDDSAPKRSLSLRIDVSLICRAASICRDQIGSTLRHTDRPLSTANVAEATAVDRAVGAGCSMRLVAPVRPRAQAEPQQQLHAPAAAMLKPLL